jgi:hypothetical protein
MNNLTNPPNIVLYLPYDLGYVVTDTKCGGWPYLPPNTAARSAVLRDAVHVCANPTGEHVIGIPEGRDFRIESYPNPFNPSVRIEWSMPQRGRLKIAIYSLRGELVTTLIDEVVAAGPGFTEWAGTDQDGSAVSSGVYFYQSVASGEERIDKILLVK